jgi:hypothetical protein
VKEGREVSLSQFYGMLRMLIPTDKEQRAAFMEELLQALERDWGSNRGV